MSDSILILVPPPAIQNIILYCYRVACKINTPWQFSDFI
jgi:hypothetical protein